MEMDNIKIIFHIEDIEGSTPSCIVFYTKNKALYHVKALVSASVLKKNACFTVYSFLEKNYSYMLSLLEENNEKTTVDFVEDNIKNKEIFKSGKNKLLTILRKNKINNLLNP
jgi:hypothetical protein